MAFFTSPAAFNRFGGAEIQILKTKEYLGLSKKCNVEFFDIFHDRIEKYNIFHNFTTKLDCLPLYSLAKDKGVKIVLSPVYWPNPSLTLENLAKRMAINLPILRKWYPIGDFFNLADIILPNSRMELELIKTRFRIAHKRFLVVPNGVDRIFHEPDPNLFVEKYRIEDFVLFVGRLEPRKNVLNLLKAFDTLEMPLVLIGDNPEPRYFEQCNKLIKSKKNVHYLGFISHDSPLLRSAYASAKVFVLPSLYETPGLTALEAGLAGCNVVVTKNGSPQEYFGDYAWYVDPSSIYDIRTKILEAYSTGRKPELQQVILRSYTWDKVAEKTLEAYKTVTNSS